MTSSDVVPFIPAGKIRCFVTGKLRRDTAEENVSSPLIKWLFPALTPR